MVRYQLSNLLLYKHELLLSKCPLTADWLLIRPLWNEISNEPLNYDPIPEHIISHTYIPPLSLSRVYFCLLFSFFFFTLLPRLPVLFCVLTPPPPVAAVSSFSMFSPHLTVLLFLLLLLLLLLLALTECNCSGRSDDCVFDPEQYRSTGSGGRCVSCRDNTAGPHCERCRENHYRSSAEEPCLPCSCNINGEPPMQKKPRTLIVLMIT